ncbi:pickpocket protein 28-like [Prorops nasuta]|uniref:pickpocket protein 28-like n=1 Tax=Prorops nasuta TaxID=863751 RepID=UPI0034CF9FE7
MGNFGEVREAKSKDKLLESWQRLLISIRGGIKSDNTGQAVTVDNNTDFHRKTSNVNGKSMEIEYNESNVNFYGKAKRSSLNFSDFERNATTYSINTVHLQNPYKTLHRFEGFALPDNVRSNSKQISFNNRETNLRSRYNHNVASKPDHLVLKSDDSSDRKIARKKRSCLDNPNVKSLTKQYCMNSSLHGLRYVGDSSLTIGERFFWIISFTVAVLTASYYIWFLYQKWNDTPIIISLSPESVPLHEIPFPSVTICNMNNARKSEAHRILKGEDELEQFLLEDICNTDNITTDPLIGATNWTSMLRFMINVSQSCTDMIYYCEWHGNQTDCEKIFNPTMTDEGICCNFNSVHKKHLFFNPLDWADLNKTFPFPSIDWNPETGYDDSVSPDSVPWRPYGAGLFYGLTLVLDAEISEYYCSTTASVGFKVVLHNPVETPKIADFAFAISPGEETRIVVTPRISSASRSILSIPLNKRKCFFNSERSLRYYRTYTQRNCVLECEANFTQKICHCVQHYMPKSSNTPICEKKDDLCAKNARRAMETNLYDEEEISINHLNITKTPSCNCMPACFEINYNIEMSQSKLLSTFNIDDRYIKQNQKYFINNMAVVHLFFVDSQFTNYVKNELFGFTEFLSSTGGLLGLCMGFSFLSLVEIFYFGTLRLWCRLHKGSNQNTRNKLQVQSLGPHQHVYPFAQ